MADEATIRSSITILKRDANGVIQLQYVSQPQAFTADVSGAKGPTPGSITATVAGTDIDLSELTTPGLCRIMNQDADNYVEVGIYDPELNLFYPLMELLPGESYPLRLSRLLGHQTGGTITGTGTLTAKTNRLRIRGNSNNCNVLVEAFEN